MFTVDPSLAASEPASSFGREQLRGDADSEAGRITIREREVLRQAARGLSVNESADETFHTAQTIKFHRSNLMRKLSARTLAHAVAIGYELRFLELVTPPPLPREVTIEGVRYQRDNS